MSEDGLKGRHTPIQSMPLADLIGFPRRISKAKIRFCLNKKCGVRLRQTNKGKFCSLCEQARAEMKSALVGGDADVARLARTRNETGRRVAFSYFH